MTSPFDPAKFKPGETVRIIDASALEHFHATWSYHHKLQIEQLAFAGQLAKIRASSMYHGGDILYELESIPGIWHEQCLGPDGVR